MPHTLLLADDSVTIQRVIELTFADEDVRVVAVSDGDEAIAVLDKTPPDIVLADIGMPGRNGYEVAEHIRKTPKLAHIPVVLLTGAFEKIDPSKAAQCDGVLNKPFEPQLVIGRVKELLAKPKPSVSVAALDAPLSPPTGPARQPISIADPPATVKPSIDNRDYFDKLDQAFAKLSTETGGAPRSIADAIDWFATHPDGDAGAPEPVPARNPPAPVPHPAPPAPAATRPVETVVAKPVESAPARPSQMATPAPVAATVTRPAVSAPVAAYAAPAPAPPLLPPLADAFAALLAAEQSSPSPAAAPVWPATPAAPVAVTEELVERVARVVLDRLSDRVVREAITEKVNGIAERLIRDEIERIKASLK